MVLADFIGLFCGFYGGLSWLEFGALVAVG